MGDTARLYQYKALLEARRLVTRQELMDLCEVSLATFKRDIAKLRDQLGMPVQFDRDRGAYFLDRSDVRTELPGLWFSPEELVALLTIQRLIEQLQPGLVGLKLKPLQKKLTDLLKARGFGEPEIASRLRMTFAGKRQLEPKAFQAVALATIARKKISITLKMTDPRLKKLYPQEIGTANRPEELRATIGNMIGALLKKLPKE